MSALGRMARAAGLPDLAAEHVRAGTSPDDFFSILVARLGGANTRTEPMTKQDQERRDYEAGRRRAEALLGRGAKRDDDEGKKAPKDEDDDERDDDADDTASADDDDEDDTASEKKKDPESERKAGERYWTDLGRRSGSVAFKRNIARK